MDTIYDWISLAIFAALVVLFLQRSTSGQEEKDVSLLFYLAAGVGCAVADYFGNHGQHIVAVLLLTATVVFIFVYLKPFKPRPKA
jgi:hypothetical protein